MTSPADRLPTSLGRPHVQGVSLVLGSCLALFLTCLISRPALAQSTRDLREENQQLATKVTDLEKELEAARQRVTQLEQQLRDLQQRLSTIVPSHGTTAPPPPPVSIDESVPLASPRALFNAVIASCESSMREVARGREGKPERANYMRLLEKWAGGARREFHGPITWHVRIVDPDRDLPAGREVELLAVDPKTGTPLGETFMVALEKTQIERLWRIYDRRVEERETIGPLELRGQAEAIITVNGSREEKGAFDVPRFACPFVEYSMRVTARSLMPVKDVKAEGNSGQPTRQEGNK